MNCKTKRLSGVISAKTHKEIRIDAAVHEVSMSKTIEAYTLFKSRVIFSKDYPKEIQESLYFHWLDSVGEARDQTEGEG